MKKPVQSSHSGRSDKNKSSRNSPDGISVVKKDSMKFKHSPSKNLPKSALKRVKAIHSQDNGKLSVISERTSSLSRKGKRKRQADSTNSSLNQTPETLSQISSIMPAEDSTVLSPTKQSHGKSQIDETWELAVDRARGQPDGAEGSFSKKSPKTARKRSHVPDKEMTDGVDKDKENSKSKKKKKKSENIAVKYIKAPLKKAGKQLKTLKSKQALDSSHKGKVKRKLDEPSGDETTVRKKAKLTFKEKKKERKMQKNNYELIQSAKFIWEELRRQDLPKDRREELCKSMFNQVQGKVKELAMAHDSARMIECLIQHGQPDHRAAVLEEVKDNIVELCKLKYAKFIIRKLLKYGSKQQRAQVIKAFHGHVKKLVRHREASDIVEFAYNDLANASQRLGLLEEFYGPTFTMFKTPSMTSLDDLLREQPDKTEMIISNLKGTLLSLIDKQILSYSLVHKILYDFFKYANERHRKDMIEALRESVVHMLHTRDGVRTAMSCIWHGSAKDRKMIIKSLKGHVTKICREETGHMLLLAIFDAVDDRVLVQKIILDELLKNLTEVVDGAHGRKVLLYLLAHRHPVHFCPDVISILQQGDSNSTSKKDPAVRARELCDHISGALLEHLQSRAQELISNSSTSFLALAIITHTSGDVTAAMEAIARVVVDSANPTKKGDTSETSAVNICEDAAGHLVLKKLILNDKERFQQDKNGLFSLILLEAATSATLKSWAASNRGCFVLISLFETEIPAVIKVLKTRLAPLKKYLKKMTFKGAEILLKKLGGDQQQELTDRKEISL